MKVRKKEKGRREEDGKIGKEEEEEEVEVKKKKGA